MRPNRLAVKGWRGEDISDLYISSYQSTRGSENHMSPSVRQVLTVRGNLISPSPPPNDSRNTGAELQSNTAKRKVNGTIT